MPGLVDVEKIVVHNLREKCIHYLWNGGEVMVPNFFQSGEEETFVDSKTRL